MGRQRRRDRHGRGARGGLLPPYGGGESRPAVPLRRTREAAFASVLQQVAGEVVAPFPELAQLRLVVELAPPELPLEATGLVGDGSPAAQVPLARAVPGDPPLLVVYRRPVELRAEDRDGLAELLHEVVVEGVAELLGVNPEEVDPGQR